MKKLIKALSGGRLSSGRSNGTKHTPRATQKLAGQISGGEKQNAPALQSTQNQPTQQVSANFDLVEAGIAYGWAAEIGDQRSVSIRVLSRDEEVGRGKADRFRADLKDAGINQGRHGFAIGLECEVPAHGAEHDIELVLVDQENGTVYENTRRMVDLVSVPADIIEVGRGYFRLRFEPSDAARAVRIALYDDIEQVAEEELTIEPGQQEVRLDAPDWSSLRSEKGIRVGIRGVAAPVGWLPRPPETLKADVAPAHPAESRNRALEARLLDGDPQVMYLYEAHRALVMTGLDDAPLVPFRLLGSEGAASTGRDQDDDVGPLASVIIPAFNNKRLTYRTVASVVLATRYPALEVIIADDCSTEDMAELEHLIGGLKIVRPTENLGFIRNCNHAAQAAKGDILIFLNNDIELELGALDVLINVLAAETDIGLVGGRLRGFDGALQDAGGIIWHDGHAWNVGRGAPADHCHFAYSRDVDYVSGAMFAIRREDWHMVEGFSDALAPCYYEDTDLCFKVRALGKRVHFTPFASAFHVEGASHGTDEMSGLKRFQAINREKFRSRWQNDLPAEQPINTTRARLAKDRAIVGRILVFDAQTPQPDKDAGSYAALQEISLLQGLGFKVTFASENMTAVPTYTRDLQRRGVEALYQPFYQSLEEVIERRIDEFDAVYITRYEVAEKVLDAIRSRSSVPILFNNADLHFLREERSAALFPDDPLKAEKAEQTKKRELEVCRRVDRVLCYTKIEHQVLVDHGIDAAKLDVTPWVLPKRAVGPSFEARSGIAFLGGFQHFPNIEAVDFILDALAPQLQQSRPDIEIFIYGSRLPSRYRDHDQPNVKIVGYVKDLDDVYHHHRLFIAPLQSGAGIKGKVLDALAYGMPSVLSEMAAEGIGITVGEEALVADTPGSWEGSIARLYDDQIQWQQMSQAARQLAQSAFDQQSALKRMQGILVRAGVLLAD